MKLSPHSPSSRLIQASLCSSLLCGVLSVAGISPLGLSAAGAAPRPKTAPRPSATSAKKGNRAAAPVRKPVVRTSVVRKPAAKLPTVVTRQTPSTARPVIAPKLAALPTPTPVRTVAPAPRIYNVGRQTTRTAAILDPNQTAYPRTSLHDFSNLLDAPAGKYGNVVIKGGHFTWAKTGQRARFWGINVANTSLQEPESDIDAIIDNFRTAGFNLLRLHHFDERDGIIDLNRPDSRHFNAAKLRKLDYWIYKAKQAGIYIYLDLLDYRRFKEGDGVPNATAIGRAARPYAVFDQRLIDLQKEYAYKLLREHKNPYTGLSYADDPAIVMLEIYDESGLFMRRDVWRTMPEPYATRFKKMWNDWLRERYRSTAALGAAWTDAYGVSALTSGESLEKGTVEVPAMTWIVEQLPVEQRRWAALARRNDGARFAYEVHKNYFREMREYLRSIGVKSAITATGRFEDLADLKGTSEELDFIGANFYYDHPYWGNKAPSWTPPSFFHNSNPVSDIDDRSMAATISLARIKDKPFVVREWNYCWPNRNRGSGMIEAACYAALHDIDAMILFVYETRPTARVSYFNVRSDPSRWGVCGISAQIFLKGLVKPSRHKIVVPYGPIDTFTYTRYHQPFYALGWAARVENDYFDGDTYKVERGAATDLIVPPGRSGVGRYEGAPAVLHTENLRRDLSGRQMLSPQYLGDYGISAKSAGNLTLTYNGVMFDSGAQRDRDVRLGLPLGPLIASGLDAIGYNQNANIANGFIDPQRKRLVFGSLEPNDVLRAALDAMQLFHGVPNSHEATDQSVFGTDTGEMWRDAASGRLIVSTDQFQALCGNLNGVGRVLVPGLRVRNLKNGALTALSLDGKPLVNSRNFVIKLVTDARNLDEDSARDVRFLNNPKGQWKIGNLGEGPVSTFGRPSSMPIQIAMEGRPLLDVYLDRGSFELLVQDDNWQFYCDTPGIRFTLHRGSKGTEVLTARSGDPDPVVSSKAERGKAGSGNAPLQQISRSGAAKPLRTVRREGAITAQYPAGAVVVQTAG